MSEPQRQLSQAIGICISVMHLGLYADSICVFLGLCVSVTISRLKWITWFSDFAVHSSSTLSWLQQNNTVTLAQPHSAVGDATQLDHVYGFAM